MGTLPVHVIRKQLPNFRGVQLLGGKGIMHGNNVGEDSHKKTRRTWVPNVQMRNLFSDALNRPFRIQTTSSVLRDMEKIGGLDAYLLKQKPDQLDAKALWLRASVLRAKEIRGL